MAKKHLLFMMVPMMLIHASLGAATNDAFVEAAAANELSAMKRMVRQKCDINALSSSGATALDAAAKNGHLQVAIYLLKQGVDVDIVDSQGNSPLMEACFAGQEKMAELLIKKGANVNHRDKRGGTPLIDASGRGHINIVKLLLQNKVDVNALNLTGEPAALSEAIIGRNYDIIELLLKAGSDPTAVLKRIEARRIPTDTRIVSLLKKYQPKKGDLRSIDALVAAAKSGEIEEVQALLKKVRNINLHSQDSVSALGVATTEGHVRIIELLLSSGADINASCTKDGSTALMLASKAGDYQLAKYLIEQGALVDKANRLSNSALLSATTGGHTRVVELLLDHKANPNAPIYRTFATPLRVAWLHKHYDVLKLLSEAGAIPDASMIEKAERDYAEAKLVYDLFRTHTKK